MKRIFHIFKGLFKSPLPMIFLIVNWIGCAFLFDWEKLSLYLSKMNEIGCKPKGAVSFGLYDIAGGQSNQFFGFSNPLLMEVLSAILMAMYLMILLFLSILILPSLLLTLFALDILKDFLPNWCPETFEIITVPVFAVFNSIYWIFLANLFEYMHSCYTKNNLPRKNPLSIYSK